MKTGLLSATLMLATPALALTPQNLTCAMPGVGEAACITGFDGRYALFDWWDKAGDTLGAQAERKTGGHQSRRERTDDRT